MGIEAFEAQRFAWLEEEVGMDGEDIVLDGSVPIRRNWPQACLYFFGDDLALWVNKGPVQIFRVKLMAKLVGECAA
jgi:hypothetical protein